MILGSIAPQLLTPACVLSLTLAYLAVSLIVSHIQSPKYPKNIKWLGQGQGWLATVKHTKDWLQEGYDIYCKRGDAYVLPGFLGNPPEVILPRSQIPWMLEQPDDVLSTAAAHYDVIEGDYNFLSKAILGDPYHEHVIHRMLARNINGLIPELQEEARFCTDEIFGVDAEGWKTVNLWDALLEFIPRATNLILVGRPLCRTKHFVDNMVNMVNDIVRNMLLLQIVPKTLKPVVGHLVSLVNRYHYRKIVRHTLPLTKKRLEDMTLMMKEKEREKEKGDADADADADAESKDWTPPNDYVTWHIKQAVSEGRTDELTPERIALRLVPPNFAALHTTTLTAQNALLDILASDDKHDTISLLREEAERVRGEGGGQWTKAGLARLLRLDSAIRESMRVSSIAQTLVHKKVVAAEGVTNAATGWHFAQGTVLGCPIWGAQHDRDLIGDDADEYDPFRYSRAREAHEARADGEKSLEDGLLLKQTSMITTSDSHLAFGHGRHAWLTDRSPGRFFAAYEMKMLLAYLLINYDLKPLKERPRNMWIAKAYIPPTQATIQVKRRR